MVFQPGVPWYSQKEAVGPGPISSPDNYTPGWDYSVPPPPPSTWSGHVGAPGGGPMRNPWSPVGGSNAAMSGGHTFNKMRMMESEYGMMSPGGPGGMGHSMGGSKGGHGGPPMMFQPN